MKYYKITPDGDVEITKEEYDAINAELREKSNFVRQLCDGEITLDDVPEDWRDEIQSRAEARKLREEAREKEEITDDELVDMMEAIL